MEKKSLLAIALSILVLLAWSALMPKPQQLEKKEVKESAVIPYATRPPASELPAITPAAPGSIVHYEDQHFDVRFDEASASIRDVVFKDYGNYKYVLGNSFELLDEKLIFSKVSNSPVGTVQFVHSDSTKRIKKEFIFSNYGYAIDLRINVQFLNVQFAQSELTKLDTPISVGIMDFSTKDAQSRFQTAVVATTEKTYFLNGRKDIELDNVKFASLREKYFALIMEPEGQDYRVFVRKLTPQLSQVELMGPMNASEGAGVVRSFRIYLGPQDLELLNQADPQWSGIIHYGTFDFIGQLLLQLLRFFYGLVHNWGWAIVILSIVVYGVLYPLSLKQIRSMKEMQALQPKIEELRRLYKDNPQKLNKEIMELYRGHKVNPLGGCLPLLLQMPIFFALYQVLLRAVSLKGAHFLWIKDLSEPDRLFQLPMSLPILGNEVNILPILMALVMFFQQKMSMASSYGGSTGTSAQQQKIMSIIFPVMFGFIFYKMPSGLVLYWFVNSGLMTVAQLWSKKAVPPACEHEQRARIK